MNRDGWCWGKSRKKKQIRIPLQFMQARIPQRNACAVIHEWRRRRLFSFFHKYYRMTHAQWMRSVGKIRIVILTESSQRNNRLRNFTTPFCRPFWEWSILLLMSLFKRFVYSFIQKISPISNDNLNVFAIKVKKIKNYSRGLNHFSTDYRFEQKRPRNLR